MGLHRTLLLMLAVGLIIAAYRRGGTPLPPNRGAAPVAKPASTAPTLTNSTAGRGLAAAGLDASK